MNRNYDDTVNTENTVNDAEQRKQAIFERLSPRRRKYINKIGYENWDPFEAPKDPIDIRRDATQRTTQQLVREFLQNCDHKTYSNAYGRGVLEMAMGIINGDDRFVGMYEFAQWYQKQLHQFGADGEEKPPE